MEGSLMIAFERKIIMINKIDDMYTYFAKREKRFGMNFGLERMHDLLAELKVSHRDLPFVHIAGTNGKGSTVNYLKNIMMEQGYKVGTFTSPHIESIKERIMINDEYIAESDFLSLFRQVMQTIEAMEQEQVYPTQFEILTVIALMYFQEKRPDFVIMETGLGGRLDSTNVIQPLLSIITNVSFDHTNILGNTIQEIATEKAGIIKENSYVITGVREGEALSVVQKKAEEQHSELRVLGEHFQVVEQATQPDGETFTYISEDCRMEKMQLRMLGKHQIENAALAIAAALLLKEKYYYSFQEDSIRNGVQKAIWRGRLERISSNPYVIVDGSHNEAGIETLIQTLQARYQKKKIVFITAALADKDVSSMMSKLEKVASHIICTQFTMDRALEAEQLAKHCESVTCSVYDDWKAALDEGIQNADDETVVVVTGSLYFLYYARPYLLQKFIQNV